MRQIIGEQTQQQPLPWVSRIIVLPLNEMNSSAKFEMEIVSQFVGTVYT